jgi:hypothetical protein
MSQVAKELLSTFRTLDFLKPARKSEQLLRQEKMLHKQVHVQQQYENGSDEKEPNYRQIDAEQRKADGADSQELFVGSRADDNIYVDQQTHERDGQIPDIVRRLT